MKPKAVPVKLFRLHKVSDGFELIIDDRFFDRLFDRKINATMTKQFDVFVSRKIAEAARLRKVKNINKFKEIFFKNVKFAAYMAVVSYITTILLDLWK